ncbi:MAG: hypothetical protein ACPHN2_04640 [Sinimarinibacterium flocculans]|uniref:hypothetical protein n=1 Tax=Sinimarinibacterium flocculans TaxID=985250 RepID=UPI003C3E4C87
MTPEKPDFEALRAARNAAHLEFLKKLAVELGATDDEPLRSNFDPGACYCACPDGPCEHDWSGPMWTSDDGCATSTTCARCGCTSMSHSLRTGP